MMTLRKTLALAAQQLAQDLHLAATAQRDAELLLLDAVTLTRAALLAHPDREITPDQEAQLRRSIERRLRHEPIQYITGRQEFYGLELHVTPAVLIPRPETEHLVESVLAQLSPHLSERALTDRALTIADVGTGSGAIAIALAVHLPQAAITALDLSPAALTVASANARVHHVDARIRFLHSDLLAAAHQQESPFDAIVSNPPYVPESDRETLHPQVRDYEPASALFAGATGLDVYQRLIPQAWRALRAGGLLALEMGHGQRDALAAMLSAWSHVVFLDDLQHIPRVVLARKPGAHTSFADASSAESPCR